MPDFEQMLIDTFGDGFDKQAESTLNNVFLNNRTTWVNTVVEDYVRHGINPNESIAKIASAYKLNSDQTQRIVEESNVGIYLNKYASTKGSANRTVEFPLADMDKITNVATTEKVASYNDSTQCSFEKVASDNSNPVNFLNSSLDYSPSLWDKESMLKNANALVKNRLAIEIEQDTEMKVRRVNKMVDKIATVGSALLHVEKVGDSAQDLLNKLASSFGNNIEIQDVIFDFVERKLAFEKEAKLVPESFGVGLSYAIDKTAEFSLGKHSLNKVAEEKYTVSTAKLPIDTDYSSLVQIAQEIKEQMDAHPGDVKDAKLIIKRDR